MTCSQSINIQQCDWQKQKATLRAIRSAVFIDEQKVPIELEWDDEDETATHFLVLLDGEPIGCARILDRTPPHSGNRQASIGRMAILKAYRDSGYGTTLLKALIKYCREQDYEKIILSAQCHAIGFYQRLGFTAEGDIFMEAGIEHRAMHLVLNKRE